MSDFAQAFETMILNEGGYVLHNVAGDRGGMTYAGIARNMNPQWPGWPVIDQGGTPPADMVREFYRQGFWNPLKLDDVSDQAVARNIFDFAVNAGLKTSAKLAQVAVGATPDGAIGQRTVQAINDTPPEVFVLRFALAKVARYRDIVQRDRTQQKFLLGWVNRTLKEAAV